MANFAPYQDVPEQTRALSPPPVTSPRTSIDRTRSIGTGALTSPSNQNFTGREEYFPPQSEPTGGYGSRVLEDTSEVFQTSLGLDLKYEACLAYLLLPPAGGVLLLILEHKSDYVRFHAWQSSLLFAFVFVSLHRCQSRRRLTLEGGAHNLLVDEHPLVDHLCR
jgi:uncharacterized membrane protein